MPRNPYVTAMGVLAIMLALPGVVLLGSDTEWALRGGALLSVALVLALAWLICSAVLWKPHPPLPQEPPEKRTSWGVTIERAPDESWRPRNGKLDT